MTSDTTAHSIDGQTFKFTAALGAGVELGGYVQLDTDGGASYLGQILALAAMPTGSGPIGLAGHGAIRAIVEGGVVTGGRATAFGAARLTPALPDIVQRHFDRARGRKAGLEIGRMRRVTGDLPATLLAEGFGRHTLVCGQSGSGKTYSLGVMLERLLLETDLRIVVLDPNSDYVHLGQMRAADKIGLAPEAYRAISDRYAAATAGLAVHGTRPDEAPLRSRFGRMPVAQQALVLNLDPLHDACEYNVFRRIVREMGTTEYSLGDLRQRAIAMFDDGARALAMRIENLDVEELGLWAQTGEPALIDLVPEDWRALVFDLGSLPTPEERSMMAASLVAHLWSTRHERKPTLVVIDEAHNVCPQIPADRFQAMAAADLSAIAGEGRKFGLYLLLVTQRPQKLHVNVLSQCENLVLMRMNSASDIAHLTTSFSHVPATLIAEAASFGLGEGLAAGRIAADPLLFKTGNRYSVEGGGDIPATWANTREA